MLHNFLRRLDTACDGLLWRVCYRNVLLMTGVSSWFGNSLIINHDSFYAIQQQHSLPRTFADEYLDEWVATRVNNQAAEVSIQTDRNASCNNNSRSTFQQQLPELSEQNTTRVAQVRFTHTQQSSPM